MIRRLLWSFRLPRRPMHGGLAALTAFAALAGVTPQLAAQPALGALDPRRAPSAEETRWVDSTLATLSPRERVAQLLMVWVLGDYAAADQQAFRTVVEHVERDGVGGIVMSLGSPIEVAAKLNYLQRRARVPLLVGSDVEPGLGRLEGGVQPGGVYDDGAATVLPSNMAIGATRDVAAAERAGEITGREARAIGIHVAFAPTADVNNNPANPVINTRSFGEAAPEVARLTAAFVRGVQRGGVFATLKHFPGHGDTDVDSHLGLPVVDVSPARLDSIELVPFRAGIDAGAALVMTAHIALPQLHDGDRVPATLSPRVMSALLRDSLGFTGLTITDALTMEGVAKRYGANESVVLAFEAGDDVLLMPRDVPGAIDALEAAVKSGRIPQSRVDASVRRLLALKYRAGLAAEREVSLDALRDRVGIAPHQASADSIAARAITWLREGGDVLPLRRPRNTLVVVYAPDGEFTAGNVFVRTLRETLPNVREVRISPRTADATLDSLRRAASRYARAVVYSYTRTLEGEGRPAVPTHVARFIRGLAADRQLVVVAGGNPYQLRQFPRVDNYLVTWGRGPALEQAAARAITGRAPITGRSPVSLPGHFGVGDGIDRP